jgi:transcriptional regulator with XRE-family HTH domain
MQQFKNASSNIKLLLSYKNWSQEVLSKKTGISLATLKRKLSANNGWTLLEAVAIAEAFDVSVEELFFTHMVPNGTKTA